jgi:hypothetical protein
LEESERKDEFESSRKNNQIQGFDDFYSDLESSKDLSVQQKLEEEKQGLTEQP